MLEWTGERFLPWLKDASIAYEHLHRYAYAADLLKGKRVLDLASGEGYGSNMLAKNASSVVGVDIDEGTVRHASARYTSKNLQYISGSITRVPIQEDHSFDAIVCFEAIEHIKEHDQLLGEVKRLLKPDGVFMVSTPNKVLYDQESDDENEFHVKELTFEEFQRLLSGYFKSVKYLGQRIHADSSIWPMQSGNSGTVREFVIERGPSEFGFIPNDKRVPLYVIAIASDAAVSLPDVGSVLVDHSNELLKDKDRAIRELLESKDSQEKALEWRDQQLEDRDKAIDSLEKAIGWHELQVKDLQSAMASQQQALDWMTTQIENLKKTVASHEEGLAWREHQVEDLEKERATLHSHLETTQHQLRLTTGQLEAILASRGWQFILRLRSIREKIKGLTGS